MAEVFVVDTNVILVANEKHQGVSQECIQHCVDALEGIKKDGRVALDDGYRIVREYLNKTQPNQPKGVGDVFLKWLLQSTGRCDLVEIYPTTSNGFREFPSDPDLANFDPPDRKFVAVAAAHPRRPPILQAADSKRLGWVHTLAKYHVAVQFLCKEDVERFHHKKSRSIRASASSVSRTRPT